MSSAFAVGLIMDTLQHTLLGQHALALVILVYLVQKMVLRLRLYSLFQQALMILWMMFLYKFLVYWPQGLLYHPPISWTYWFSPFLDALLWPWLFYLLNKIHWAKY